VLAEFGSAVDAVRCAMEAQDALGKANSTLPENRQINFRIGVHVGDVMVRAGDLFGDGVNIAARLQMLARAGGLCVSGVTYDQVRKILPLEFTDLGAKAVKNIEEPIRAYEVNAQRGATALVSKVTSPIFDRRPLALPDKPSIAVLPFQNMSGDPDQEYFADGISEDIITDLSKISGLMVISRNSTFTYKGRSIDIRDVGRDLGVRSVLEGSVRRSGNRVRITAQLIDASTGGHLWAERFDRDLSDIFAVQDDVTGQIVRALQVTLSPDEKTRVADGGTKNIDAYDVFLRGRELLFGTTLNRGVFQQCLQFFSKALELDPNYSQAYAGLAVSYLYDFQNRWSDNSDNSLVLAKRNIRLAIEKDPGEPIARFIASRVATFEENFDLAKSEAELGLILSPNSSEAYGCLGEICTFSGRPLEAVTRLEQAMRLNPAYKQQYLHLLGVANLLAGKYETAATLLRERIALVPGTDFSRAVLASALGHLGDFDNARRIWRELKDVNPQYSFSEHFARQPYQNKHDVQRIAEGLAKAGLISFLSEE
jgi:adenylate cyclase